jgi:hypothetical protein
MDFLGGNAPENGVSSEIEIRRALLRSRFADTILKAHEKTLDQVCAKMIQHGHYCLGWCSGKLHMIVNIR